MVESVRHELNRSIYVGIMHQFQQHKPLTPLRIGTIYRSLVTDSPYFYLSLTLMILGAQFFLTGFLGELIVRNSHRRNDYEIEEEITAE